jgi:methylmalonyl-CoA mutase cobalamin-binding domain/chain
MTRARPPIRLLTAVPICDGHDSAISTINLEFIRQGLEVIYLGYHRSADDIARAAVQEDVRAVGISSYNGGHVEFFSQVIRRLRERGGGDIGVFGGGGGTITHDDAKIMQKQGVARVFFPGTSLDEIVAFVKQTYAAPQRSRNGVAGRDARDHRIARALTRVAGNERLPRQSQSQGPRLSRGLSTGSESLPRVIGITGPGGAGKTTLIDELVLRFLRSNPTIRIAVLSHDPSIVGNGALLGDRAAMLYCQDDRVFMRSLATAGRPGGLAPATEQCLHVLRNQPDEDRFDVIFLETVGIGQEAVPFGDGLVDLKILVMSPDYGSRLQLQKIAMLDDCDVVVVNKSDLAAAKTASSEVEHRLAFNDRGQRLVSTMAKRHRDSGVDELFRMCADGGTGASPVRILKHGRGARATRVATE